MTPDPSASPSTLSTGLDQLTELFESLRPEQRAVATPCEEWTVAQLGDHVVGTVTNFARMLRGEQVDWSAPTPQVDDLAADFRKAADEVLAAWSDGSDPGMALAEIGTHTWDLATALDRPTATLDPEVAEQGLAFMRASLTDERRGDAFASEQPAPEGADAYARLAAFAGRTV